MPLRTFRSMVVHEDAPDVELLAMKERSSPKRSRSKTRSRRVSHGGEKGGDAKREPIVQNVLMHLVWAIEPYVSTTYATVAFDTVLSYTRTSNRRLEKKDIQTIERAFQLMLHTMTHVFLPVERAHMSNNASTSLDVQHILNSVTRLEREESHTLDKEDRAHARSVRATLQDLLGLPLRRQTT